MKKHHGKYHGKNHDKHNEKYAIFDYKSDEKIDQSRYRI